MTFTYRFASSPISYIYFVAHFFICFIGFCIAREWNYEDQASWGGSCTKGSKQSPIAIDTSCLTSCGDDFSKLRFNYDPACSDKEDENDEKGRGKLTNTGHSFDLRYETKDDLPSISEGGLNGTFVFEQLHFHWNAEHVLDGTRYPLEGHFVHYNSKYGNFNNALNYNDGVAVIGTFYKISDRSNRAFNPVIDKLPKIARRINEPVNLDSTLNLRKFLPKDTSHFYRYSGSLTTPDCNEVVTWTLLPKVAEISQKQYDELRRIYDSRGTLQKQIYRDLQKLNGRSTCVF